MKNIRQKKILDLIENNNIGTQEELANMLCKNGYEVTQATVSRDIRELGLSKAPGPNGIPRYILISHTQNDMGDKYIRVLKDGFNKMDMAQNILVIKTVSGMAMAVAAAIDALEFTEVVGSIAGDDTIFVAVRTVAETKALMDKIRGMLNL